MLLSFLHDFKYDEQITYDPNGNIETLSRNAPSYYGTAEQIDELVYTYQGNRLLYVKDERNNPTGYESLGGFMSYDHNGNMVSHADKRIDNITYNFLNLPTALSIEGNSKNLSYEYRADGTKLKKTYIATSDDGKYYASLIEYLDGFHYVSSGGDEIWAAYEKEGGAYEPEAFTEFVHGSDFTNILKFFPTSEGFYDYENNEYIYQYKDHLDRRVKEEAFTKTTNVVLSG